MFDPEPFFGVLFSSPLLNMCLLMESPKLREPATLPVLCICIGVPVSREDANERFEELKKKKILKNQIRI